MPFEGRHSATSRAGELPGVGDPEGAEGGGCSPLSFQAPPPLRRPVRPATFLGRMARQVAALRKHRETSGDAAAPIPNLPARTGTPSFFPPSPLATLRLMMELAKGRIDQREADRTGRLNPTETTSRHRTETIVVRQLLHSSVPAGSPGHSCERHVQRTCKSTPLCVFSRGVFLTNLLGGCGKRFSMPLFRQQGGTERNMRRT